MLDAAWGDRAATRRPRSPDRAANVIQMDEKVKLGLLDYSYGSICVPVLGNNIDTLISFGFSREASCDKTSTKMLRERSDWSAFRLSLLAAAKRKYYAFIMQLMGVQYIRLGSGRERFLQTLHAAERSFEAPIAPKRCMREAASTQL